MTKILVIENDINTLESLQAHLSDSKYEIIPIHYKTNMNAKIIEMISENNIEVIILDLILDDVSKIHDLELCKQIRNVTKMPIIITSFSEDVSNKVRAFGEGADDYVIKPYHLEELSARLKALLRRLETREMIFGSLQIDPKKRIVQLHNEPLELTNTEFDILLFLIENRLQPISRDRIAHTINAIHEDTGLRSIDTHIRNLRNKLGDSAKEPKYIQSVWGIGYKFCM